MSCMMHQRCLYSRRRMEYCAWHVHYSYSETCILGKVPELKWNPKRRQEMLMLANATRGSYRGTVRHELTGRLRVQDSLPAPGASQA